MTATALSTYNIKFPKQIPQISNKYVYKAKDPSCSKLHRAAGGASATNTLSLQGVIQFSYISAVTDYDRHFSFSN